MFESIKNRYTSLPQFDSSQISFTSAPKLFIQIIILQFFYYVTAFVTFFLTAQLLGYGFSIHWMFSWSTVSFENSLGLTLIILWLLDSLICVVFITFVIGRSKLAWDFAITIHLLNFMFVTFMEGFPRNIYWWLLQIISASIMVVLGTYTTRWIELRDTFFDGLVDVELGQTGNDTSIDNEQTESIALKDLN